MENQNQIGSDDTGMRASLLEIEDDATEATPEVVTEGIPAITATKVAGTGSKRLVNLTAEVEAARKAVLQNLRLGGSDGWLLTHVTLPPTVDRVAIYDAWIGAGLPTVLAPPEATRQALFRAAVVATAPKGAIVKSTKRGRVLTVASGEATSIGSERGFLALYDVTMNGAEIAVIPGSYGAAAVSLASYRPKGAKKCTNTGISPCALASEAKRNMRAIPLNDND